MRPNYKIPPIITALAIAAGLFASAVTGDTRSPEMQADACLKVIGSQSAGELS